jgi:hypothetical protein
MGPAPAVGGQLARAGCERARRKRQRVEIAGHFSQKCTRLACVRWRTIVMIIGEAAATAVHVHRDIYNVMNEHSAGVVLGVALSARRQQTPLLAWGAPAANDANSRAVLANCDRFFARLLFPSSANISACAALLL